MLKDLIHAARMLRQSKGWTIVVLLSLALGIGANTALFTAVNGVLLQTVSVPDPGSLVRLKWAGDNDMVRGTSEYGSNQPYNGKRVTATFSYPGYLELRKANQDADRHRRAQSQQPLQRRHQRRSRPGQCRHCDAATTSRCCGRRRSSAGC